ncbi:MAG: hypothetical protein JWR61_2900 [Ferruginibacter sp.]|nr:hypothetical protein [Ferruginibacter sp.]
MTLPEGLNKFVTKTKKMLHFVLLHPKRKGKVNHLI